MKKIVGVFLVIASLVIGYMGYNKVAGAGASVEVLGMEINASDQSAKEQGYLLIGLAVVALGGGLYAINRRD